MGVLVPEVTVVIPSRDRCQLLLRTLGTVLWQENVDLEVVIVDDASSDDTPDRLAEIDDPRVRVHRHPEPLGVGAARNRGIAVARGTWVAFLDDDDLWAPEKLRAQLDAAIHNDAAWAFGSAVHFVDGPRLWTLQPAPASVTVHGGLVWRNLVPAGASNVVAHRRALERTGAFDPTLHHLADWDLWIRLAEAGRPAVVEQYLVAYRLHQQNMLLETATTVLDEVERLDRRYLRCRGGRMDRTWIHDWMAGTMQRAGRRRDASRVHLHGLRDDPARSLARAARALVPVDNLHRTLLRQPADRWPPGVERWVRPATTTADSRAVDGLG